MRRQTNLGKRFGKILLMAALSVGCMAGTVLSVPAGIVAYADNSSSNTNSGGTSSDQAKDQLQSYCNKLKTEKKPDKYVSAALDAILSNGIAGAGGISSGADMDAYVGRVKDQMNAVMTGASGETTESYLFLADNFTIPTVKYGEVATIALPVINYSSAQLTDVVINPNMESVATDDFPFEIQNSGYTQLIKAIPPYNPDKDILSLRQDLVYTFAVRQDVKTGYYPVKFDVLYTRNNATVKGSITTYVNVIGKPEYGTKGQNKPEEDEKDKFVAQPRIIVTGFETNPADVYAGDTFTVYIHVKNTSTSMPVKNVLFDMQAAVEGSDKTNTYSAFLPTSGSSSVYMDSIAAGQEKDIAIEMTAKADLAQKPYVLQVNMKYDYDKTANVTDTASVSIPIKQESKFDTSTAEVAPSSTPIGSQSNVMFSIYNTGKTTLFNLQVKFKNDYVEGGEAFIGNLESGQTGNVDTMVTATAPNEGTITAVISYEDEAGNVTETEKEIALSIYEESFDDSSMDDGMWDDSQMDDTDTGLPIAAKIGIPVGVIAAVIIALEAVLKIRKRKKAKKQQEEDLSFIDEE